MSGETKEFSLEKTYEITLNPPPPMKWEEYEQRVLAEWDVLLNSETECTERNIHDFLVQHPSMIPGAYSMTGPSGHGPFPMAVLSESPLSGVGMKIPDFIWLAKDSATFKAIFIEIESPGKRWFTDKEVPTSDLTQAMNQLAQWRAWLNRPENHAVFYETFEIPQYMRSSLTFRPEFVLIYGRRKEFDEKPHLRRMREQFERHGQVVMTFDRLRPARDCGIYITARKTTGAYRAVAVPATIKLGPHSTQYLSHLSDLSSAIMNNEWISQERREFLVKRLPYWTAWATLPNHGIITSGDSE